MIIGKNGVPVSTNEASLPTVAVPVVICLLLSVVFTSMLMVYVAVSIVVLSKLMSRRGFQLRHLPSLTRRFLRRGKIINYDADMAAMRDAGMTGFAEYEIPEPRSENN